MATNGLSTTFSGVEGEGYIKISVPTTQGATARQLPDQFNDECFIEVILQMGTGATTNSFVAYNPGGTTSPALVLANGSTAVTGITNVPRLGIASDAAYTTAFNIFLYKDANGRCSIRQNNNGTGSNREQATAWVRKIG